MARKQQGTGRKKIDIRKIENKLHLKTTFTKRRKGLFKKVADFCTSSGIKAAVFTFSPYGRAYAFGNPSEIEVIERFYAAQDATNHADECPSTCADGEVCEEISDGFWWKKLAADVEFCEIDEFKDSLSEHKKNLIRRIEDMQRRRQALMNLFVN